MVVGIALGAITGVQIDMAMNALPIGIAIGSLMGLTLGICFDSRKAAPSPTGWKLGLLVGGLVALAGVGALLFWRLSR